MKRDLRDTLYSVSPNISGYTSVTKIQNGKTAHTNIILPGLTGAHFGIQNLTLLHKEKSRVCISIMKIILKESEGLLI